MTHPPTTPQRRKEDQGPLRGLRAWWERWGGLFKGIWGIALSIVLTWAALGVRASQHETDVAARSACVRAKQFGPRLIDFYEFSQFTRPDGVRQHVLTHKQAGQYRRQIPRTCPSK